MHGHVRLLDLEPCQRPCSHKSNEFLGREFYYILLLWRQPLSQEQHLPLKYYQLSTYLDMHFYVAPIQLVACSLLLTQYALVAPIQVHKAPRSLHHAGLVKPKVFIISMYEPEGDVWYGIPQFDLLAHNITVSGFSTLYPDAHCTASGEICQLITGEAGMPSCLLCKVLIMPQMIRRGVNH